MIEVSVIIPVFNDLKAIKLTLDALRNQSYQRDRFEIIVIDNGSTDETVEWLEKQKDVILLYEIKHKGSPYSSRNRGIEIAKAEIIALLDSTCVPDIHWMDHGIKFFNENKCDLFGGNIKFNYEDKVTAGKIYDSITNVQMELSIKEKNATKTANLWIRKYLFEKVGKFIEGVRSGEDVGWTGRCTKSGYKLEFCSNCIAFKYARGTKELLIKQIRVGKGQARLWGEQGKLHKMIIGALRKLLPISPKSMKMLMKRNTGIEYSWIITVKLYVVSYISGLATLYGNIVGLKELKV